MDSIKRDIVQYALRRSADFDKHLALEKTEHLKHVARDLKDKKADFYSSVYSTLLERIDKDGDQFKTYVLALLGDRDYERIIEAVSKVDKTFNKTPNPTTQNPIFIPRPASPVLGIPPGNPHIQGHTLPSAPSPLLYPPSFPPGPSGYPQRPPFRRPYCSYCNSVGHSFTRCFRRRSAGPYDQSRPFGKHF